MKTENPTEVAQAVRLPILHGYTKEFYDWCHKRELRFQRCQKCGAWRHPPRPMCASCHSLEWERAPTKGKGKVDCWTPGKEPGGTVYGTAALSTVWRVA